MAELLVYDEIVSPGLRKMCGAGMDAELFAEKLAETSGDLTVRINSPGGDVDNGLAIYNQLQAERAKGRRVTCVVDGGAHSIAGVIAMAGDEVHMAESSRMLVHHPRMMAMGTEDDMRQALQRLEAGGEAIRAAYRQKTGQSDDALGALMSAETFLTAPAAQRLKFADKVISPPPRAPMQASAESFHHPLARAVALLAAQTPQVAAKDNDMSKKPDVGTVELVEQAALEAAQTEVASLKAQLAQAQAEKAQAQALAPVLVAVQRLTGKESAADQVAELLDLADRIASLPTAQQQQQQERAQILGQLQQRNVSPDRIAILEAAADSLPEGEQRLVVLRAGAAKLQAPRVYAPAGELRPAEPKGESAIVLTDEIKANYRRCGIADEALMLSAEKSRRAARVTPSTDVESDEE